MATILKRGNKWQAKVRRKGYPVCSRMFTLRADAEVWARGQETKMDRSVWRDRGSAEATTLYALLERYLLDVVPEQRGAEVAALRVRTLMRDPIAQYCLAALTPLVVAQWRDARLTAGAGSTVNRELNLLSAALNWSRRELMIAVENPVAAVRRPKNPPPRTRRLDPDEERRLLEALEYGPRERKDGKRYCRGTRNPYISMTCATRPQAGSQSGCPM